MTDVLDRELEEEARSLLGAVRVPPAVPAETRARMHRRLALALPLAVSHGGPASGPTPRPPAEAPGARALATRITRALGARVPAWSLLASFAAGGALALAVTARGPAQRDLHDQVALPPVAPVEPLATSAAPASPRAIEVATPEEPPRASSPAPSGTVGGSLPPDTPRSSESELRSASSGSPPPSARASASERGGSSLEAERALLDMAHTALGRADGGGALRATEEHARRFPRGALAEEREAMGIQALRLLHRDEEASARLDRFRARFPTSFIRPALEAAEGEGPPQKKAGLDGGAP